MINSFIRIKLFLFFIFVFIYTSGAQTTNKKKYQKFKAELKKANVKLYDYRKDKTPIQLSERTHTYKSVEGIWSEDRLVVYNNLNKKGCIDENNNLVIEFLYDDISNFSKGYSKVIKDGKWGVINKDGKVIVPIEYEMIDYCCNNYFMTKLNDLYGLMSNKGEIVFYNKYSFISEYHGKFFQYLDGKFGVVNIRDSIIVPFIYDYINMYPTNNLIEVKYNNKFGAKDTFFNDVIPYAFDYLALGENGFHKIGTKNNKFGHINSKGKIVVDTIYDGANLFYENLAQVVLNNKTGYVDTNGKVIIPFQFDQGMGFHQGLAAVKVNNKWGFCNKKGELVINTIYDNVQGFNKNNIALVELDGKTFWIDKLGSIFK